MITGLTPEQEKQLIEQLTAYANEGATDDELREFRKAFIEELKKKEVSKPVSTEPANQPTKPSATTGGLDYTRPSAEKSLYGKTIGGIVEKSAPLRSQTKEKPKQPPMDVTYTPEAMPSETTQETAAQSIPQRAKIIKQDADNMKSSIERGEMPNIVTPELQQGVSQQKIERQVDEARAKKGMPSLEEERKDRKFFRDVVDYELSQEDLRDLNNIVKNPDDKDKTLQDLQSFPEAWSKYSQGIENMVPAGWPGMKLGDILNPELRKKVGDAVYQGFRQDYEFTKNRADVKAYDITPKLDDFASKKIDELGYKNFLKPDETSTMTSLAGSAMKVYGGLPGEIIGSLISGASKEKLGDLTVIDMSKVEDLANQIADEMGVSNSSYVKDLIRSKLVAKLDNEQIKPKAQAILNEGIGNKTLREVLDSPAYQYQEAVRELRDQTGKAWDMDQSNIDINARAKLSLDSAYESIQKQAKDEQDLLLSNYNSQIELAKQGLAQAPDPNDVNQQISEIYTKAERNWQNQQDAIFKSANRELEAAYKKFTDGYNADPKILERMQTAYSDAFMMARRDMDKKRDVLIAEKGAPLATLGRSYMTALGGSIRGYGGAFDNDVLKFVGQALEQDFKIAPAETKEWSDLLEGDAIGGNFQKLFGMLGGSMTTGLVVSGITAAATGGTGVVPAITAGISSFLAETADIAGRNRNAVFEKTGSESAANKAYEDSWRAQFNIAGLYAFEGLPWIGKGIKAIKNLGGRMAVGAIAEYIPEYAQEFVQGIHEENIQEGNDPWMGFSEQIRNPQRHIENAITLTPTLLFGAAGQIGSKTAKQEAIDAYTSMAAKEELAKVLPDLKKQWVHNMVMDRGGKFAKGILSTMHQGGQISTEEFSELNIEAEIADQNVSTAKESGLKNKGDINLFSFLSRQANNARKLADKHAETNPGASKFWEEKYKKYSEETAKMLNGETPDIFTITYADGSQNILTSDEAKTTVKQDAVMQGLKDGTVSIQAYKKDQTQFMDELRASVDARSENTSSLTNEILSPEVLTNSDRLTHKVTNHPNYNLLTSGQKAVLSFKLKQLAELATNIKNGNVSSVEQANAEMSAAQNEVTELLNNRTVAKTSKQLEAEKNKEDREAYVLDQKKAKFIGPRVAQLMSEEKLSQSDASNKANQEWADSADGKRQAGLLGKIKSRDEIEVAAKEVSQKPSSIPFEVTGQPTETQEAVKAEESQVGAETEKTLAVEIGSVSLGVNVIEPETIEERKNKVLEDVNPELAGLGGFSVSVGKSANESVPVGRSMSEGKIETVQYADPETGEVDLIISATPELDYVAYVRMYENGKATNKWTTKMESKPGAGFSELVAETRRVLPQGHEWTEGTSVSTDGLRVFGRGLDNGYEVQYDENGNLITNKVAINAGARSSKEMSDAGIQISEEDKAKMNNLRVNENDESTKENVKNILLPYLSKLGLNEDNIYFENGEVYIDLPVLKESKNPYYDQKDQTRVSGEVGKGQEPIQTQPIETTSGEAPATSGVLQTQEEVELKPSAELPTVTTQAEVVEEKPTQPTSESQVTGAENLTSTATAPSVTVETGETAKPKTRAEKLRERKKPTAQAKSEEEKGAAQPRKTPTRETETEGMIDVMAAINSTKEALAQAGIDVVPMSNEEFMSNPDVIADGGGENTEGIFFAEDGKILLNLDMLKNKWGKTIVFHEGTHPIINIIRNTDPKRYKAIVEGIRREAQKNPKAFQSATSHAEQYRAEGEERVEDEFVTEVIAQIASGKLKLSNFTPSLRDQIISMINDILRALGLPQINLKSPEAAVRAAAEQITELLNKGGKLSEVVGSKNVGKFQSVIGDGQRSIDARIADKGVQVPRSEKLPLKIVASKEEDVMRRINELLDKYPNALTDKEQWKELMSRVFPITVDGEVFIPAFPEGLARMAGSVQETLKEINKVSDEQRKLASEGLKGTKEIGELYRQGKMDEVDTGLYFLWNIMSIGISPYPQESGFLQAVNGGVDKYIKLAAAGEFNENTLKEYLNWVDEVLPKGTPGAGSKSNLNSFGKSFLSKAAQKIENGEFEGKTKLQALHEILSDRKTPTDKLRRKWQANMSAMQFNNKIFDFILLTTGRSDLFVTDRVRVDHFWGGNNFKKKRGLKESTSLYDGSDLTYGAAAGAGFSKMLSDVPGLVFNELANRTMTPIVEKAYKQIGVKDYPEVGRFHWETWVAASSQEVSHGSIDAIVQRKEKGEIQDAGIRQGKYGAWDFNFSYRKRTGKDFVYEFVDNEGNTYVFDKINDIQDEIEKQKKKTYETNNRFLLPDAKGNISRPTKGLSTAWYDAKDESGNKLVDSEKYFEFLRSKAKEVIPAPDVVEDQGVIIENSKVTDEYKGSQNEVDSNDVRTQELIEEAKKHKTFSAFIKAQGKPIYHGSKYANVIETEGFKIMPREFRNMASAFGEGVYFADKKRDAYATRVEDIVEAYIPKNVKLKKAYDSDAYKIDTKSLIEQGYDGVELYTGSGKNITIFDPSIAKTKTQLNDIWNRASEESKKGQKKGQRAIRGGRDIAETLDEFAPNVEETVDRIKSATKEDGATLNLDGTVYDNGGLVVPASSMNVAQKDMSAEGLFDFMKSNEENISSDIFKIGLYRFPDRAEVSYDLNIVIPREHRAVALEFGRLAGQESLFDLDTYENVKTGADGKNPRSFTAEELAEIAQELSEGKLPRVVGGQRSVKSGRDVENTESPQEILSNERTEWKGYKLGDVIDGNKLDQLSGGLVGDQPGQKFMLVQTPLSQFTDNREELLSLEKEYKQEEIDRLESMKSNFDATPPIPPDGDGMHRIISAKELGHKTILQWKNIKDINQSQRSVKSGRDVPSLVDDAGLTKNMTEDEDGNYIFYHKTNKPLSKIDPKFFGKTLATSRDERPGVDISMYYTRKDAGESMVGGNYSYIVRVPKDKVYPINTDPLNLYDKAKKEFQKDFPGQTFDPNKQIGYITKEAQKLGYDMTVAKWQKGPLTLRAQTTKALKPEVYYSPSREFPSAIVINEEIDTLKPNEKKMRRKGARSLEGGRELSQEDAYNAILDKIDELEATNMSPEEQFNEISQSEEYASLSPEDRMAVNDSYRESGVSTADKKIESVVTNDIKEQNAVLQSLKDDRDLAYIYRNFPQIIKQLQSKNIIETKGDCI